MKRAIKKKAEKKDKNVSTQDKGTDGKMSITLLDHNNTKQLIESNNNNNNNNENNANMVISSIQRTESEENLLNAIKETENLRNILEEKKEKLAKNKLKDENELITIKQNIKDKSLKLENLSSNTKQLLSKLNSLNNQINERYNKMKILQAANKLNKNYLNELKKKDKKKVNQGKKIIFLNNKIIDKFKIQKGKLEKIMGEDMDVKLNDYKAKLEELKNYEKEIANELEELRLIKKNHEKKCTLKNEDLNKVLERIKNEYNEEYKFKSLNENNSTKNISIKKNNSYVNNTIQSLPKIINGNNLTIPTSENKAVMENQNNSKLTSRNYKSMTNLFGEDYFIQKDLLQLKNNLRNNIKSKLNQKLRTYIVSYSEQKKNLAKNKNNDEKKSLFSKLERDMLSQIIPKECLQIYQDKYKTIEEERLQIKKQLHTNESKKKINEEKAQLLFITEKKDSNIIKKNIELNSRIRAIKKKLSIIIKDINSIEKELNNIREKYNTKKEENDKLKSHWISFYDDIKNKKIGVKEGETVSQEEIDYINKWGNNVVNNISNNVNKKINNEEVCDNSNNVNKKIKLRKKSEG